MANSGINWIDITFDWCVNFLYKVAGLLGISYEEINIWLFVIIGPISLLISIFLNYYFYKKIKNLKKIIQIQKQEISEINEVDVSISDQTLSKIIKSDNITLFLALVKNLIFPGKVWINIHYQALKLFLKKINIEKKPLENKVKHTFVEKS